MVPGPDRTPIFLHAGWRTGGSWLWTRFRNLPGTLCLYEPLHEGLAAATPATIGALHPTAWASGHPAAVCRWNSATARPPPAAGCSTAPACPAPLRWLGSQLAR